MLCETAPMELIGTFGFKTSREVDKFAPFQTARDAHGVPYVTQDVAARFGCKVVDTLDAGTHMLIIGLVEEAEVLNTAAPMTYAYYHRVKNGLTPPKASSYQAQQEKKPGGWRCKVCGYIYEGETLPADYKCPICGQPASVFEKL